jgi:hypothetical protein
MQGGDESLRGPESRLVAKMGFEVVASLCVVGKGVWVMANSIERGA